MKKYFLKYGFEFVLYFSEYLFLFILSSQDKIELKMKEKIILLSS
ncbi:MAG: hypothetical protein Ct9H90mP3_1140 [Flammeovirgaceae bacterium]|nr:MAG: hypothetical protein Ct9H90mP3_1140 [Flammeovirgaceae bacterium]